MKVQVVPDRVENQYLRTRWSDGLKELSDAGLLSLYTSPLKSDDRLGMAHVKLWKTPSALAIGSWNFTQPGANLPTGAGDDIFNVEAGFIFSDQSVVSTYLGEQLDVGPELFASPEQMKQERLFVPKVLPFDLRVVFDWQAERYSVSGNWLGKELPVDRYQLKLPGVDAPQWLAWDSRTLTLQELSMGVSETRHLLVNHRYEVLLDGETEGSGLIIEKLASYRRAQQYDDLRGLLDALVISAGEPSPDDVNYRVRETEDGEVLVDSLYTEEEGLNDDRATDLPDISYFRLFSACHHYADIIGNCSTLRELEHWVFTRPGCLQEFAEKSNAHIGATSRSMFNWFLAHEVNDLCTAGRARLKKLGGTDNESMLQRWAELKVGVPRLPRTLSKEYRQWLKREYQWMKRNREAV